MSDTQWNKIMAIINCITHGWNKQIFSTQRLLLDMKNVLILRKTLAHGLLSMYGREYDL